MSLVEVNVDGGIGSLMLNRPEKLNALSPDLLAEFDSSLAKLAADPAVRCILLHGAGRSFCVGYDYGSYGAKTAEERGSFDDWIYLRQNIERWLSVWRCPKPVVAAVQGHCLGGATQLAVCCDLTVVADDATIGWPTIPLGGGMLSPMSYWLIGTKKARELSYIAGSQMTGTEAAEWGWANYAVPSSEVFDKAMSLARRIAKTPADLLMLKKRALNRVMDVQGFSEMALFGAEWDALAHEAPGCAEVRERVADLGLREAIKWFRELPGGTPDNCLVAGGREVTAVRAPREGGGPVGGHRPRDERAAVDVVHVDRGVVGHRGDEPRVG